MEGNALFAEYRIDGHFDEMFTSAGRPRPAYRDLYAGLAATDAATFASRCRMAERSYMTQGITFSSAGREQPFPFDLIPRLIPRDDWRLLEKGLVQRVKALDLFLADVYGPRRAIRDGVVPNRLVATCPGYQREMVGVEPAGGRWIHIAGIDLVRDRGGVWRVLEDNVRTPSGLSYVLQNRAFMKRVLPEAFAHHGVEPVDHAPLLLLDALRAAAPPDRRDAPTVAVLTPGPYNAAYSEHAFLAREMGVPLVQGHDLSVRDGRVWIETTAGRRPVDVIYRRVDDAFLDPVTFRSDSLLGVAGLMQVYREGGVGLANAVGTGVADDKAVYVYVPDIIRYFLEEEPIIPQVPTYLLERPEDLEMVLDNLHRLVVKAVDGAGGYGMLIGPHATEAERAAFASRIRENPRGYIAQETVDLSRAPVFLDGGIRARHVDLRPFVLYGDTPAVVPGGLTRVALREGSLVVNSSQGGGSKDTWVLS
ncbi:MAG: circularly permuted type 2 ATP-grasp protein [Actinomycetota bacterium]